MFRDTYTNNLHANTSVNSNNFLGNTLTVNDGVVNNELEIGSPASHRGVLFKDGTDPALYWTSEGTTYDLTATGGGGGGGDTLIAFQGYGGGTHVVSGNDAETELIDPGVMIPPSCMDVGRGFQIHVTGDMAGNSTANAMGVKFTMELGLTTLMTRTFSLDDTGTNKTAFDVRFTGIVSDRVTSTKIQSSVVGHHGINTAGWKTGTLIHTAWVTADPTFGDTDQELSLKLQLLGLNGATLDISHWVQVRAISVTKLYS